MEVPRQPAAQRPAAETGRRDGAHEVHSRTPGRNVSAQARAAALQPQPQPPAPPSPQPCVSAQVQISKMQDAGEAFTPKIELEKRRIDELDRQMEVTPKPCASANLHAASR